MKPLKPLTTRTLVWLAVAAFAFCVLAISAPAQTPDCNLAARRFDNYLGDGHAGGFTARRYVHHAVHVGLSIGVAELAHVALHTRAIPSTAIGALVLALPHARDVVEHRPVGGRDAIADASLVTLPLVLAIGHSGHSWQSTVLSITSATAMYIAGECWQSP